MKHALIILMLLLADFARGQQATSGDITANLNNKLIIYYIERPNIQVERYRLDLNNIQTENFNGNNEFRVGYQLARSIIYPGTTSGDDKFQRDILNIIGNNSLPVALFLINDRPLLTEQVRAGHLLPSCFDDKGYIKGCYHLLNPRVSFTMFVGSTNINEVGITQAKNLILSQFRLAQNDLQAINPGANQPAATVDEPSTDQSSTRSGRLEEGDNIRTFKTSVTSNTTETEVESRLVRWITRYVRPDRSEPLIAANRNQISQCLIYAQENLTSNSSINSFEISFEVNFHQIPTGVESVSVTCSQFDIMMEPQNSQQNSTESSQVILTDITNRINDKFNAYSINNPNHSQARGNLSAYRDNTEICGPSMTQMNACNSCQSFIKALCGPESCGGDLRYQQEIYQLVNSVRGKMAIFIFNDLSAPLNREGVQWGQLNSSCAHCVDIQNSARLSNSSSDNQNAHVEGYIKNCYCIEEPTEFSITFIIGYRSIQQSGNAFKNEFKNLVRRAVNDRGAARHAIAQNETSGNNAGVEMPHVETYGTTAQIVNIADGTNSVAGTAIDLNIVHFLEEGSNWGNLAEGASTLSLALSVIIADIQVIIEMARRQESNEKKAELVGIYYAWQELDRIYRTHNYNALNQTSADLARRVAHNQHDGIVRAPGINTISNYNEHVQIGIRKVTDRLCSFMSNGEREYSTYRSTQAPNASSSELTHEKELLRMEIVQKFLVKITANNGVVGDIIRILPSIGQ